MLDQIIVNISKLRGVLHASLYKDGEQLASSFPDEKNDSITQTAEIIEQAFSALESIQKSHSEMYFSIDDRYLAAFRLHDSHLAVLLTEKKINFPLVHMGIKSASEKIRHMQDEQQKQQALALATETHKQSLIENTTPAAVPTESSLLATFDQYSVVLTSFLGPAAKFVVEDCVDDWKKKYTQIEENLPHLIILIQEELDTEEEKEQFAEQIEQITE